MQIDSLMTKDVACVGQHQSLNEAAHLMWEHDCGSVPVVDERGQVIAMITDRDISMAAYTQGKHLRDIPVSCAMSKELFCCRPDDDLARVESIMQSHQVRRIPILDDQSHALGIVSLSDIARACRRGVRGVVARDLSATLAAVSEPTSAQAAAA
jgi:CBS domain-containing protein